ncbi:AAA domain-containing protein [Klebsiella sp. GG_Kp146]|uniref:DEAD/DEAH box helicase n=1 Tax=Klebsiella sp. GG_Kp146 TaxID=3153457 RepID=UPI0032B4164C
MKESLQKVQHVFRFWKAIEALTPQSIDKENARDIDNPAYMVTFDGLLPWTDTEHVRKPVPSGKVWRYSAQCGIYNISVVADQLEEKLGAHDDVAESRNTGKSRLFDVSFSNKGIPQATSFMLSMPAWAASQVLNHDQGVKALKTPVSPDLTGLPALSDTLPMMDSGFPEFDQLTLHIMQWIDAEAVRLQRDELAADVSWIKTLGELVLEKTGFPYEAMEQHAICLVKCATVRISQNSHEVNLSVESTKTNSASSRTEGKGKEKTKSAVPDDLINSFYIHEMEALEGHWKKKNVGRGFFDYMTSVSRENRQVTDVRTGEGLDAAFDRLRPTQPPVGTWPSLYPLAFSQQLAVNELWRKNAETPGIFAVNGPPGTGKTTLLRDVVAAVVTARAGKLIEHKNRVFLNKGTFTCDKKTIPFFPLHDSIAGTSIIVASANNGAVENISLELPGIDAVPEWVPKQSDYFSELASHLMGKPAWGLLAAKLGNKENRENFLNTFWWKKPDERNQKPTVPPETFSPARGEGLHYHLNLLKPTQGARKPAMSWSEAVIRYQKATVIEDEARQELVRYSELEEQIKNQEQALIQCGESRASINAALSEQNGIYLALSSDVAGQEEAGTRLHRELAEADKRVHQHEANKPGILMAIFSLGKIPREWWGRYQRLTDEMDSLRTTLAEHIKALTSSQALRDEAHSQTEALKSELALSVSRETAIREKVARDISELAEARTMMGDAWPDRNATDEQRELSAPWLSKRWRDTRERMFLAALDVHRAFIESHPVEMSANLNLVSDWLNGKEIPDKQAALALDSLSLVVPVISTTFASVPRMFKKIGKEAIGWLLIDEAGQALPQQAAGAVWRAKRTVVVGDPKQLEPVSGIPSSVEGALAQSYDIPASWWPGKISAQVLADQTMELGTWLPDVEKGQVWVGCPLRVHRRCDDPMFSISNNIAYGGLMVHGKKQSTSCLPDSGWLDVKGKSCEGNWIAEEGTAVEKLLLTLKEQYSIAPDDVFLISPFKDCAMKLRKLASRTGFRSNRTGTVHTTQGKEAAVVVLVLGGNIQKNGAKSWAASKPNLLNVAVSRARQRLYVIGERSLWEKHAYFSSLSRELGPLQEKMHKNAVTEP